MNFDGYNRAILVSIQLILEDNRSRKPRLIQAPEQLTEKYRYGKLRKL